jgi:hypothetical protein
MGQEDLYEKRKSKRERNYHRRVLKKRGRNSRSTFGVPGKGGWGGILMGVQPKVTISVVETKNDYA